MQPDESEKLRNSYEGGKLLTSVRRFCLIAFLIAFFPIVIDSVVGFRSVELEKLFVVIEHALPDRSQLRQIARARSSKATA